MGNMAKDRNRGIEEITYDARNNPMRVTFEDGTYTDYCGNTVVVNGEVSRVAHDKGYITFDEAGDPLFHYYLRDHLGSVRVVFNEEDSTEQVNHYYASGALMDMSTGSAEQPLKYNGKELLREWGMNAYDYGARWMLPVTGPMFMQPDPLCEKYYDVSPYSYCKGNFMNAVDPDGRSTWVVYQGEGKYKVVGGNLNDNDRNIYVVSKNIYNKYVPQYSIGITTSITTFYKSDDNAGWQTNSIIDINDKSGDRFLSNIIGKNPPMFDDYIKNARHGMPYDFKVSNGSGEHIGDDMHYRGMPIGINGDGQTIFSSARDIGNIAAGYIAAANGMTWEMSRMAFNIYQGGIEGISTRNAEFYGWRMGYNNTSIGQKAKNLLQSFASLFHSIFKNSNK